MPWRFLEKAALLVSLLEYLSGDSTPVEGQRSWCSMGGPLGCKSRAAPQRCCCCLPACLAWHWELLGRAKRWTWLGRKGSYVHLSSYKASVTWGIQVLKYIKKNTFTIFPFLFKYKKPTLSQSWEVQLYVSWHKHINCVGRTSHSIRLSSCYHFAPTRGNSWPKSSADAAACGTGWMALPPIQGTRATRCHHNSRSCLVSSCTTSRHPIAQTSSPTLSPHPPANPSATAEHP